MCLAVSFSASAAPPDAPASGSALPAAAAPNAVDASAPDPQVDDSAPDPQVDEGYQELELASSAPTPDEKKEHARRARTLLEAAQSTHASWRAAGGLALASIALGSPPAAAAWYWIASDLSDYSQPYLGWQKRALSAIFDQRAAITFEYSRAAKNVYIDELAMPTGGVDRPFALDPGEHDVRVISADGGTAHRTLRVKAEDVGKRLFFKIEVHPPGWVDPRESGPVTNPRLPPEKEGMSALQIVTIVSTVALASGIAIGGSYVLFGENNPYGFNSAEGAAIITTELVLIGAGTFIAIVSD